MECTKLNCPMQAGTPTDNCGENCPWRTTAKISDLISRAAALDTIDGIKPMQGNMEQLAMKALCWAAVKTTLAVDAVPVVHGRWIHLDPRECATISGKCSCCGWEAHYYEDDVADMPYCPNCGAKMDGETNG